MYIHNHKENTYWFLTFKETEQLIGTLKQALLTLLIGELWVPTYLKELQGILDLDDDYLTQAHYIGHYSHFSLTVKVYNPAPTSRRITKDAVRRVLIRDRDVSMMVRILKARRTDGGSVPQYVIPHLKFYIQKLEALINYEEDETNQET